jgi:peptide/nickel transport system substrate-binding protein
MQARSTTDRAKRQEAYTKIATIAYEEVPYLWVAQRNTRNAHRSWVKGYEINPMMYWFIPFNTLTKAE